MFRTDPNRFMGDGKVLMSEHSENHSTEFWSSLLNVCKGIRTPAEATHRFRNHTRNVLDTLSSARCRPCPFRFWADVSQRSQFGRGVQECTQSTVDCCNSFATNFRTYWQLLTMAKTWYRQMRLSVVPSVFEGGIRRFMKDGGKTDLMAPLSSLVNQFVFMSIAGSTSSQRRLASWSEQVQPRLRRI
jgi:hypothetical protein